MRVSSHDVEVTRSEVKMLSNTAKVVIYEQILCSPLILGQSSVTSDVVEVIQSDVK